MYLRMCYDDNDDYEGCNEYEYYNEDEDYFDGWGEEPPRREINK